MGRGTVGGRGYGGGRCTLSVRVYPEGGRRHGGNTPATCWPQMLARVLPRGAAIHPYTPVHARTVPTNLTLDRGH